MTQGLKKHRKQIQNDILCVLEEHCIDEEVIDDVCQVVLDGFKNLIKQNKSGENPDNGENPNNGETTINGKTIKTPPTSNELYFNLLSRVLAATNIKYILHDVVTLYQYGCLSEENYQQFKEALKTEMDSATNEYMQMLEEA